MSNDFNVGCSNSVNTAHSCSCYQNRRPQCGKNEISPFAQSHINRYYDFMKKSGLGDRIGLYY